MPRPNDQTTMSGDFGSVVDMTADGSSYIVGAPNNDKVFIFTKTAFNDMFPTSNPSALDRFTVRETVNTQEYTNSNFFPRDDINQAETWHGLLISPTTVPYAYPPYYDKPIDPDVDNGMNTWNPDPTNTPEDNLEKARQSNPKLWELQLTLSIDDCSRYINTDGDADPDKLQFGSSVAIVAYDGRVSRHGSSGEYVSVTHLVAVAAEPSHVFIFAHATSDDEISGTDEYVGSGWFFVDLIEADTDAERFKTIDMVTHHGLPVSPVGASTSSSSVAVGVTLMISIPLEGHLKSYFLSSKGTGEGGSYKFVQQENIEPSSNGVYHKGNFGEALQLGSLTGSKDGCGLAVGSRGFKGGIGTAFVFHASYDQHKGLFLWTQVKQLNAWDEEPTNSQFGQFGFTVSISGYHVVVGVKIVELDTRGKVYVFKRKHMGEGAMDEYVPQIVLYPEVSDVGDRFGESVYLSTNYASVIGDNARSVAHSNKDSDYFKSVLFVGSPMSAASARATSGLKRYLKGAVHTFATRDSTDHFDDGYQWKEETLLVMYEKADSSNENNVPSQFGRMLAANADGADLIVGHSIPASSNTRNQDPPLHNKNPGMTVYFHDTDRDITGEALLVAVNSFAILAFLIFFAGCGSLCCGPILKRYREGRRSILRTRPRGKYGEKYLSYMQENAQEADARDRVSLLGKERDSGSESSDSFGSYLHGGDGNSSSSSSSSDEQTSTRFEAKVRRRIGSKRSKRNENSFHGFRVRNQGNPVMKNIEKMNASRHSILSDGTDDIELTKARIRVPGQKLTFNNQKNEDHDVEANIVGSVVRANAGKKTDFDEEVGEPEAMQIESQSQATAKVAVPHQEASMEETRAALTEANVELRAAESATAPENAIEFGKKQKKTRARRKRAQILAFRGRDMTLETLLAFSLSTCSAAFLYMLYLRHCYSIFAAMLSLQLFVGLGVFFIILIDMFFPECLRTARLCIPMLWSGLERHHLVLRNHKNYRSKYLKFYSEGDDGIIRAAAYDEALSLDWGYCRFVWKSLNWLEKLLLLMIFVGGGGTLLPLLRYLPWRQTLFSVFSRGYPSLTVLKYCEYSSLVLYSTYIIVLVVALLGPKPSDADPEAEATYTPADGEAWEDGTIFTFTDNWKDQEGVTMYDIDDQPLSALNLTFGAISVHDWSLQRAGYPPKNYDIVTSGAWLCVLFLVLCFVQIFLSLRWYILPIWRKGRGKLECLYGCIACKCFTLHGNTENKRGSYFYDRQMLGAEGDDDEDVGAVDITDGDEDRDDMHIFGLDEDTGELQRGWWDGPEGWNDAFKADPQHVSINKPGTDAGAGAGAGADARARAGSARDDHHANPGTDETSSGASAVRRSSAVKATSALAAEKVALQAQAEEFKRSMLLPPKTLGSSQAQQRVRFSAAEDATKNAAPSASKGGSGAEDYFLNVADIAPMKPSKPVKIRRV